MYVTVLLAGALLGVVFGAALVLGADTPTAALLFSSLAFFTFLAVAAFRPVRVSPLGATMFAAVALLGVIGALRGWLSAGAGEYASLLAAVVVWTGARTVALDTGRAERLWGWTILAGTVLGCLAFFDTLFRPEQILWWERPSPPNRLATPFLSPNTAAMYFGALSLMALANVIKVLERVSPGAVTQDRFWRAFVGPALALLVCAACLFYSGSRAGILSFALAASLLVTWQAAARWREGRAGRLWSGLAVAAILCGLFAASSQVLFGRLEIMGWEGGSSEGRMAAFRAYPGAIALAPWFGHGLGGFEFARALVATANDAGIVMHQKAAHNIVFQWLIQAGVVGTAGLLAIIGLIVADLRNGLMRRQRQRLGIRTVLVVFVFVALHSMVDFALEIPAFLWLFAWILGLGAGIAAGGSRRSTAVGIASSSRKLFAVACVAPALAMSIMAFGDRMSAQAILQMPDGTFEGLVTEGAALEGSPNRLVAVGDRALRMTPPDAALAARAFERATEAEPRDGRVWAKLAYARHVAAGSAGRRVIDALRQSYLLMPYGEDEFRVWRLTYVAGLWAVLPDDVRAAALRDSRLAPRELPPDLRARYRALPDR